MLYVRIKCPIRPWPPACRSCYRGTRYISYTEPSDWQAGGIPIKSLDTFGLEKLKVGRASLFLSNIIVTADEQRYDDGLDCLCCGLHGGGVGRTEMVSSPWFREYVLDFLYSPILDCEVLPNISLPLVFLTSASSSRSHGKTPRLVTLYDLPCC